MSDVSLREYIEAILEERLRGHLVEHALIDQALEKTDESVDARIDKIDARLRPIEEFRGKALGLAVLLSVVSGVIGAFIRDLFA